jgi:heme/copper-type cytochrome/quinol oxidase subunit 2
VKISFHFPHTLSSNATRQHRRRSLILACALIVVLPLAWRGVSCGHDFDFHLQSWLETAQHWREGVLYPHWDASANYGAGEPRFVFYPPATWMIGAALGTLLPWNWTPLVFTLLALVACGLGFYAMAREWMPEDAAAVGACVYLLNPYLLFVAYERTAYGELLSAVLLPLLALYGLRKQASLLPLTLIVAALWLTNAPSAVMGCYFLALIVTIAALRERGLRLVLRAAGAFALGLGLAAFYIVPAYYEERWVEIARAIAPGMRVEDSFLFEHTGALYHDQVLRTASWIAVAMLVVTFIAAWLSRKSVLSHPLASQKDGTPIAFQDLKVFKLTMTVATAVILLLLLPFSGFVWHDLPELKFLQFPWRWLLVLGVAMSALVGLALRGSFLEAKTRRSILIRAATMLTLAAIMSSLSAAVFWQPCDDEDNITAQRATIRSSGFEGTDEYTAAATDNGDIQQDLPQVRVVDAPDADEADSSIAENPEWQQNPHESVPAEIKIPIWRAEKKTIEINVSAPAYALLQLVDYPAWRVTVNGQPSVGRPHRDDGLMIIPLPTGRSVLTIQYGATPDVKLGRAISLLALCIVIALYAQAKRRQNLRV